MNRLLNQLIREAIDKDALIEAVAEEIAGRIDLADLAKTIVDSHKTEILATVAEIVAYLLDLES